MPRLARSSRIVVAATGILGSAAAGLVAYRFQVDGTGPTWLVTVLGLIVLLGWYFPIVLYQDGESEAHHLDEGFFVVLVLVLPPDGVLIAFGVAALLGHLLKRAAAAKLVFNLFQALLSSSAGVAVVYLVERAPIRHLDVVSLAAALLGAAAYYLVNTTAVAAAIAASGGSSFEALLFDGIEIDALLVSASVALGLVCALAIDDHRWAAVLIAAPFWFFRQAMTGRFQARHDRARLLGLFEAALKINATMGQNEVRSSLVEAAAQLLRSPDARLVEEPATGGNLAARLDVFDRVAHLVVSGRSAAEPFDEADRSLLDALTAVGTGALKNAFLYEELRSEQQRLVALTASLGEGVCAFGLDGAVTFMNPAAQSMLGRSEDPDPAASGALELLRDFARAAMRREDGAEVGRATLTASDGTRRPVEYTATAMRAADELTGAVVAFRDVSERVVFEEKLAFYAFHDALTGLPNRRVFLDRLQHALGRSNRSGATHAVLFADVDRFKVANDSLGHSAGDQVLVAVAERLRGLVREGDTLARFGGDEFTLLLEDVADPAAAEAVAARMVELAREPIAIDGGRFVTTSLSVGVALAAPGAAPDDLLHDADVAMYEAKHHGSDRHVVFDADEMGARSAERVDLETGLRNAIDRGELIVRYQPMFSTATREVVGVEALVRWNHPERGLLDPDAFIALAEETGLIEAIGRQVLDAATTEAQRWRAERALPLYLAVNLSARQFESPSLVPDIDRALRESGLDPARLCLEITETLALADIDRSVATLTELKQLGVTLAIDDFGTGYSSLTYLKRLPVDIVKLDRSFVQDLELNPVDAAIVLAVVELARTIGMSAVAEGVETPAQFDRLVEMDCPVVQGFLLGGPMTAEDIAELIRRPVPPLVVANPG